jgi:hypothetical protein
LLLSKNDSGAGTVVERTSAASIIATARSNLRQRSVEGENEEVEDDVEKKKEGEKMGEKTGSTTTMTTVADPPPRRLRLPCKRRRTQTHRAYPFVGARG